MKQIGYANLASTDIVEILIYSNGIGKNQRLKQEENATDVVSHSRNPLDTQKDPQVHALVMHGFVILLRLPSFLLLAFHFA